MKNLHTIFSRYFLALVLVVLSFSAHAQYALLKSADQQFDSFNFSKAIELYNEAYQKKATIHSMERLAQSHYSMRNYKEAEQWYQKIAQLEKANKEHVYRYAEVLQNNSKFREAKAQYNRFIQMDSEYDREVLQRLIASCDSAMLWIENPIKNSELSNARELNSEQSEYGAVHSPKGLVFVSDRFIGDTKEDETYGWTGNSYLNLFKYSSQKIEHLSMKRNKESHIGPPTFSPDGKEVIFSLTRKLDRAEKRRASKNVTVNIEIFIADTEDPNWIKNGRPFRYNNVTEWSVGDPFLSNSGDTLYFSSDMPGGYGGTDLYYSVRTHEGNWGEAVNLGSKVNTKGDERFPSMDQFGSFYFSSNGHFGMGGLDIFKLVNNEVVNLKYPINSSKDDFSIRFNKDLSGYMASNRLGGRGADDIYVFNLDKKIQLSFEGKVYNNKTKIPVSDANVVLIADGEDDLEVPVRTGNQGQFRFNLTQDMNYKVTAEQVGFKAPVSFEFNTHNVDSSMVIRKDLFLNPVEVKEVVVLRNIYFDFDKTEIRPDAELELNKVYSFLKSAPTTKIELSAHTDSRGTEQYNLKLSQRRADAAIEYLVSKGIARDKLVAKGYGFKRMVNDCGKSSKCTEDDHAQNRRVEFVILED